MAERNELKPFIRIPHKSVNEGRPHVVAFGLGIPEPADIAKLLREFKCQKLWVSNVSRTLIQKGCDVRSFLAHGRRLVPKRDVEGAEPHFLSVGNAVHGIVESWAKNPDASPSAVVLEAAENLSALASQHPYNSDAAKLAEAAEWLPEAARVGYDKHGPYLGAEEWFGSEVVAWFIIDLEKSVRGLGENAPVQSLMVMGRLDCLGGDPRSMELHHHQLKTSAMDLQDFLDKLEITLHERVYGFWIDLLTKRSRRWNAQGLDVVNGAGQVDWRPVLPGYTYGGSKITVWRKIKRPDPPEHIDVPKTIVDAVENGHVAINEWMLVQKQCTPKQYEKYMGIWSRYVERKRSAPQAILDWEESLIEEAEPIPIPPIRLVQGVLDMVFTEMTRCLKFMGAAPLLNNENFCNWMFRKCPYFRSTHCAGEDLMDDPARWMDREPDYVDTFFDGYMEQFRRKEES